MSNKDLNVVIKGDLFEDHFDVTNGDQSNKVKIKFPAFPANNVTDMTFEGNKLKFKKDGQAEEIDLSPLAIDISADAATFDARTGVLTLTQTNGGKQVTVDLNKLAETSIGNDGTSAVTLSGNGSTADPLKADVKVKAGDTNLLKKETNGELNVDKDKVKEAATEAATAKLATLNTITLKNAFGNETLGTVYEAE